MGNGFAPLPLNIIERSSLSEAVAWAGLLACVDLLCSVVEVSARSVIHVN